MKPTLRVCSHPDCAATFPRMGRETRCLDHRQGRRPVTEAAAIRQRIYKTRRWQTIRKTILNRDGYACTICGATEQETRLVVDHIGGINHDDPYNPDDLRTLCLHHSGKADGGRANQHTLGGRSTTADRATHPATRRPTVEVSWSGGGSRAND